MDGSGGVFGSGKITCRWFNMPFIHKLVATGQEVVVYGKVKDSNGRLIIDHPEFEILREDDDAGDSIHLERLVPIYRNVAGIAQRRLREIMHLLLLQAEPETLAAAFEPDGHPPRARALSDAHFPESIEQAQVARRRFALEEFFGIQLNVAWRRSLPPATNRQGSRQTHRPAHRVLQEPAIRSNGSAEALHPRDHRRHAGAAPMNRLLQGDVGAGKTFVAMAAMLLAVDSGCQAALMAPTQILAEQHYLTFRRWLEPLGVRVALEPAIAMSRAIWRWKASRK